MTDTEHRYMSELDYWLGRLAAGLEQMRIALDEFSASLLPPRRESRRHDPWRAARRRPAATDTTAITNGEVQA